MANRLLREKGAIKRIAKRIARLKYPDLNKDEIEKISKREDIVKEAIFQINVVDLEERLFEEYQETKTIWECKEQAIEYLTKLPEELLPNIDEWLDNKPLSNIKCHGVSINDILSKYDPKLMTIMRVLNYFMFWKEVGFENEKLYMIYFNNGN